MNFNYKKDKWINFYFVKLYNLLMKLLIYTQKFNKNYIEFAQKKLIF